MEGDTLHLNVKNSQILETWQLQRQLQNKEIIQILLLQRTPVVELNSSIFHALIKT